MNEEKNNPSTKLGASKSEAALREEKVLEFWRENKIFEKSLEQTEKGKEFIFYEGPPTANGKPGIHHLEARAFKDAIPRYKTMRGYHVRRKGGWDTHGLPVELQVEKKLGLNSKKAIEEYGIAKFNQECKENVWEYLEVWNKFTERIGFWVDQENPYVTYHNDYIESVWNVVKKVDEQKLVYKDYKVVPWCPRCGTALSSHELAQGYEDVKDISITAKFKIKFAPNTFAQSLGSSQSSATPSQKHTDANSYFLAWTTTPWTLPGNIALAVGKDIVYVEVKVKNENLILAKERLSIIESPYEVVREFLGLELAGMEYEPLFPYLKEQVEKKGEPTDKMFKVYVADFVTTTDGTGIVHTAVMYGQDDFELGTKVGLPKHHLVNPEGKFVHGTGFLEGRFVKEVDGGMVDGPGKPTMDVDIIKYLQEKNLFFHKELYEHSYPHCWRCKTALIYYARDSWYIRMSNPEIKEKLITENQSINWEPAYTRDGRFGEWLREIKDWAISRERYWGTPLPVWVCAKCEKRHVAGSLDALKVKTKKSGNKYFVARHGEAISNTKGIINCTIDEANTLTDIGKEQVNRNIEKFADIDLIFCSPMPRTKETAGIISEKLGLDKSKIIFDNRLWEINVGDLEGKREAGYLESINGMADYFETPFPNGESRMEVHKRMGEFLYELESKYSNKKILIISHGDPILALFMVAQGYTKENLRAKEKKFTYYNTGEIRELDFSPLPHNQNYELDLHKPYIDEVKLICDCGGDMARTKEVMDVWFDSGAMPFAQDHYPFENKEWVEGAGYPADFISEAIDQTRGWFYTLHAIGVLMGRGKAYKNVICLGHLLDASGKKMSKSLGNIVDPWEVMNKYGVDTLRLWMYSVNQPGESKNFDEKTIQLLQQQVFSLLYNVLAFYELYRDTKVESNIRPKSKNVLDQWILVRLDELVKLTTEGLDNYKLLEPTRALRDFLSDLSTWYLRRSRERIKGGEEDAKITLYFILKNLSKVMAPFAPFSAEDIWLRLRNNKDEESVHLAPWPKEGRVSWLTKLFSYKVDVLNMEETRRIVSLGLQARQKAGIPVKQALARIKISVRINPGYVDLIKDELNIKEVVFDKSTEGELMLDTEITEELKQEGNYRELLRAVQDMRKKLGLTPSDVIVLSVETDEKGKSLIQKFEKDIRKVVLAFEIKLVPNNGEEVKIGDLVFKVKIVKMQ